METQWQNPKITTDHIQYPQTLCQPQCEIFKDYSKYSELIYTITSLDELEQRVLEGIKGNLDPSDDICQIVVSPRQTIIDPSWNGVAGYAGQQWSYDWVLVLTRENLILWKPVHPFDDPMICKIPIRNLLSITWGRILLQSWVDWSWAVGQHVEHARIDFNTSGEKPIEETLGYIYGSNIMDLEKSHTSCVKQSQIINTLPNKFVEHLPLLLTPQEKILAAAYYPFQPAIWKSWHGLFQKQERQASPSIAFLLTEHQFIMICEEDHASGLRLGTFIRTVKRKNILKISTEDTLAGTQLILLVGEKNAEERIFIRAPEECFEEIIERFCFNIPN